MSVPSLQYEPNAKARPLSVERNDGVTRILVKMPGIYAPVPEWTSQLDFLSLVVVPVWFVGSILIRTCLRLQAPPRAVFEVTADRFRVHLREPTGQVTEFDCPRSAVAEVRANRYEPGLWINVPGHVKETYLTDLHADVINRLEGAIAHALAGDSLEAKEPMV